MVPPTNLGHPAAGVVRDQARRERLAALVEALAESGAGREFDLRRVGKFDDLRASVPLLDADEHSERVTARLGFAHGDDDADWTAGGVERERLLAAWRQHLGGLRPQRIALLHAPADDPRVDRVRVDDLEALARGELELLRIPCVPEEPAGLAEALAGFEPDCVFVPSLATVAWLEGAIRAPLERRVPSLRWLFASHDLGARVRCRLPVLNAGWLHPAGRIGLPSRRSPWQGYVLASDSTLIELLAHGDPELDARRRTHDTTVLPEHAVLGQSYELVLSSALGFLRLRSGVHVRVVGFASPASSVALPRPRVLRLAPPPTDVALEGVTLAGAWLTASVRQSFLPEDPALVAAEVAADPEARDPDARSSRIGLDPFADTELGASRAGARRKGPRPRALLVRVEVQGQSDAGLATRLAARIDADLRQRSAAYEWLRARDDLWSPWVMIAEAGTARRRRERRLRSLWAPVEHPVVRVAVGD